MVSLEGYTWSVVTLTHIIWKRGKDKCVLRLKCPNILVQKGKDAALSHRPPIHYLGCLTILKGWIVMVYVSLLSTFEACAGKQATVTKMFFPTLGASVPINHSSNDIILLPSFKVLLLTNLAMVIPYARPTRLRTSMLVTTLLEFITILLDHSCHFLHVSKCP